MWIIVGFIAYYLVIVALVRFFQAVHTWDEEVEQMQRQRVSRKGAAAI